MRLSYKQLSYREHTHPAHVFMRASSAATDQLRKIQPSLIIFTKSNPMSIYIFQAGSDLLNNHALDYNRSCEYQTTPCFYLQYHCSLLGNVILSGVQWLFRTTQRQAIIYLLCFSHCLCQCVSSLCRSIEVLPEHAANCSRAVDNLKVR